MVITAKGPAIRDKIGPKKSSPTRPRPAGIKARPGPSPINKLDLPARARKKPEIFVKKNVKIIYIFF